MADLGLHVVADESPPADESDTMMGTDVTIADLWQVISGVIARELADHPDLRRRVLVALANVRGGTPAANAASAAD